MKVFVFETRGKYRSGDLKVIFADSKAEAERFLIDDERNTLNSGMPSGLPGLADDVILKEWTLIKEEKPKKGIVWKMGGVMLA